MIKSVNKLTLQFNGFFSYFYAKYEDRMVEMLLPQHFTKGAFTLFTHPHPPIALMIMEVKQNEKPTTKQPS